LKDNSSPKTAIYKESSSLRRFAGRKSTSANYSLIDFNRTHIEAIRRVYPEFGTIVDKLDLF